MTASLDRIEIELAAGQPAIFRRRPGAGDLTPAVLVHALAGSWRWWREVTPHLDPRREIWIPDRPGFGESRGLPRPIDAEAEALADALARLGIRRAHLVGHSMGGAVAAELASRRPEQAASLTLIDAAGWPTRLFPRYLGRLAQPWSWCRAGFLPTLVSDVVRTRPLRLAAGIRHLLAYDIRPALRTVRSPTFVVWGERDRLFPPDLGRALAALVPGARFQVVPGAGHVVPGDRPADLARALEEFWESV